MQQLLTQYQSQYYAWLLTRRAAGDSVESLASTLVDSQVDLNPHQVDAALVACRNPLSRGVLLADEVGLGKTIEARLVISQRWAERRRKILIIVPANLRKQWHLSEDEAVNVLDRDHRLIAREIHAQMMAHFWEEATEYEVQVSRGFTELRPCNYTATAGQTAHHFRETVAETSRIKQMLFGGFARCLYPLQKFDSDTERRFAIILERDALKWFKPAKGQFQIYYKLGTEQPEYIPDFVAETGSTILMVETKARGDINTQEVQAKAAAALQWCQHASDFTASVGGKPWRYLLVPHDEVNESRRLADFLRFVKA